MPRGGAGNTRAWLKRARKAGCLVEKRANLGGEIVIAAPDGGARVRISCRRKDTPRALITLVRQVEARKR